MAIELIQKERKLVKICNILSIIAILLSILPTLGFGGLYIISFIGSGSTNPDALNTTIAIRIIFYLYLILNFLWFSTLIACYMVKKNNKLNDRTKYLFKANVIITSIVLVFYLFYFIINFMVK